MKKVFLYSLFVMLFISACGGPAAPPPIAVNLSTGAAQAMDQGQSVVITATVTSDSSNKGVTWALTGAGAISGQTTTSVTYSANGATGTATVTATSIADTTKSFAVVVTVTAAPAITTTTLAAGVEGTAYSQAVLKTGGAGTVTFSISAGALPAGLTLSSAGTISGTPTGPNGTANFTVKVTDSSAVTPLTAIQVLAITISLPPAPAITTTTLPAGVEGTAYSQVVAATGFGALTFTTSAGTLPPGLTLSSAGLISGTPVGPNATSNFTVKVTDSSNPTQSATQALSIAVALPPAPSITTATLAPGVEGTAYSQSVVATGGLGALTFTVSAGTLPPGLSLSNAGLISGTPLGPNATSNFTIKVTDSSNPTQSVTKPLSILVNLPPAPSISPTTLPGGNVGTPYNQTLTVSAGLGPFTWSVSSGTLPGGLSLTGSNTTATISGTPTTAQTNVAFTIRVTDTSNPPQSAPQAYTVTISAPLPLSITTTSPLPQGAVNMTYSATISATGGIAPYTFSLDATSGPLPTGLSFSSGSNQGLISGTPTVTGTFTNIIVDVRDSQGAPATAQKTFTLTVAAPPSIATLSQTSGTVGTSITITGTNFGTTQGSSTVKFNGVSAGTATSWSSTSIAVTVPAGATTGNVVVTVSGAASNGSPFTVVPSCTTNCTLSGTVTGPSVAGVTITLTGAGSASTTTAANGTYSFTNLTAGTYTITPSLAGYTYAPPSATIAINANTVQNFVATSALTSYSISGTLTYNGSKTGRTYIRVFQSGCTGCNTVAGISISTAPSSSGTSYTIRGLQPTGTGGGPAGYIVSAEIDTMSTGEPNASNPAGFSTTITIPSANVPGVNFTVVDATPPAPMTPTGLTVSPGDKLALAMYKAPRDANGKEIATSYKIYIGTDLNALNGTPVTFAAHGAHDNVYILHGLTNGATYFKMSAFTGNVESAVSSVVGPVTIGPTSGPNTVSGTVTFPGTPTGPLYVGVFDNNTGKIYVETIPTPFSSPVAYSVAGVPNGSYTNFAIIDNDNSGIIGVGDLNNVTNNNGPLLKVSGNTIGNITLTNPITTLIVSTNHQQFNGSGDTYNLSLGVNWGTKRPVAVTLFSGPNVPLPYDMGADSNNTRQTPNFINSAVPVVGDTYQFQVTFSDGTTQNISASVTAVLTSFARNLAMNTPVAGSATIPVLNWSAPASPPASYTYSVGLNNANGAPENWNYNGGNNSNGIPSTQLNVTFNVDGSANPSSSLTSGTTYNWWVQVRDDNGNQAQFMTTYTAP